MTRQKPKARIATLAALTGMLIVNPTESRVEAQNSNGYTEQSSIALIQKKLSESQMNLFFGIGNAAPADAKKYSVGKGWQGAGIYVFADGKTTCHLIKDNQLNNWYYIKHYPNQRDAPEKNGELQPPDPEVEKAESSLHSKRSRILRGVGSVIETPAKAIGGVAPVGVGGKKGPVQGGATAPGVEAGGAGTVAPQTKPSSQGTAPGIPDSQTANAQATTSASADPIENLKHMLKPDQLQECFGIGNMTPYGVKTYSQSEGWKGDGIYNFDRKKVSTPPLNKREQLGWWYYLLYGEEERAEELAGRPLDPILRSVIDNAKRSHN